MLVLPEVDKVGFLQSGSIVQWKPAGPITQRSEDQNLALLTFLFVILSSRSHILRQLFSKILLLMILRLIGLYSSCFFFFFQVFHSLYFS